jgi:hypothetical protein
MLGLTIAIGDAWFCYDEVLEEQDMEILLDIVSRYEIGIWENHYTYDCLYSDFDDAIEKIANDEKISEIMLRLQELEMLLDCIKDMEYRNGFDAKRMEIYNALLGCYADCLDEC